MALTPAERQLAADVGFDVDICDLIKGICDGSLNRLFAFTEQFDAKEADGVAVAVKRDEIAPMIAKLQPQILPRGYRVFWSGMNDASGRTLGDAIVALKTTDEYDILRMRQTNGLNYNVSTEDVLQKLLSWRKECEFEIMGADSAWVAIWFNSLPRSLCAFAEEIYDFGPDTVEQGTELRHEASEPEAFAAARRLCPTLSEKMERKLEAQMARFEAMNIPPEVRARLKSSGFTTPTDMGIRLLAYQLKETHQLFLWWD